MKKAILILAMGLLVAYSSSCTIYPTAAEIEDRKIAKAQSVCKKVGYSKGTEAFRDCIIKVMSHSEGKTVVVGSRGRGTSIYPLHCRQMGGASAC
jgi:putative hemolysin